MTRHWLMDEWRDTFVTELRLRGVPGHQTGEALAEVDAHCADSGQAPGEVFGDPVRYAAARSRAAGPGNRKRISVLPAAFKASAVVAGVLGLLSGTDAVAHRTPGAVTVGQVIPVALAPLLIAVIMTAIQQPGHGSRRGFSPPPSPCAPPPPRYLSFCGRSQSCRFQARPCSPPGYCCSALR